jgi:hypothetical protein
MCAIRYSKEWHLNFMDFVDFMNQIYSLYPKLQFILAFLGTYILLCT